MPVPGFCLRNTARPVGIWRSPRTSTTSAAGDELPRGGVERLSTPTRPAFSPADRRASSSCVSLLRIATWITVSPLANELNVPEKRRTWIEPRPSAYGQSRNLGQVPDDVVALHLVDEETQDVHHRKHGKPLTFRAFEHRGIENRDRHDAWTAGRTRSGRLGTAVDD